MTWLAHRLRARQLRRDGHDRARVLRDVVDRLRKSGAPSRYSTLWTDAIYGWGNEKWTALEPYLSAAVRAAERTKGPVLECGSGLTTMLMGAVTTRSGASVHSLEHNPEWRDRVRGALRDHGLTGPAVHLAPLRNYGDYDWYDAPLATLPRDVTLVVCDGPPESTRGGRRGMIPVMRDNLAPGCVVLLDDLVRPAEQELVRSWVRDLGATATVHSGGRKFARVKLPEA